MNVWTYWAGPKPRWVDTCLRSLARCCVDSRLRVLTPDTVDQYTPLALDPRWKELPPGVGTDCLRAALLAHHGGLWVDADTVCVADPVRLLTDRHDPKQFLYSTWPTPPDRVIAGYVYSPKGHPVALHWYAGVRAALDHAAHIGWGDLGEKLLTRCVRMADTTTTWQMPLETFLPVNIDAQVGRYFEPSGWRDLATDNTIAFGLNYSWMTAHRRNAMECPDPNDGRMIHRLLRDNDAPERI